MKKRRFTLRNLIVMILSNIIIGFGIGLFKLSLMGNDPSSAFIMAVADLIRLDFSIVLIFFDFIWFIAEFIWGRNYIGLGTLANWGLCGISASAFVRCFTAIFGDTFSFPIRFLIMIIGILVISPAVSLYQNAHMGIAPYDALSIMMDDRLPIPYFWCRITTDIIAAALAYFLGGIIGLGTVICALGLGPLISLCNPYTEKLYE